MKNILCVIGEEYYLIHIDVKKYTETDEIVDFLSYREIKDKESLSKAMNEYCEAHGTASYKPHWFFGGFDAVISR